MWCRGRKDEDERTAVAEAVDAREPGVLRLRGEGVGGPRPTHTMYNTHKHRVGKTESGAWLEAALVRHCNGGRGRGAKRKWRMERTGRDNMAKDTELKLVCSAPFPTTEFSQRQ